MQWVGGLALVQIQVKTPHKVFQNTPQQNGTTNGPYKQEAVVKIYDLMETKRQLRDLDRETNDVNLL